MDNEKAKIIISVSEGKFEISGSENFVSEQIENFKELITNSVTQLHSQSSKSHKIVTEKIKEKSVPNLTKENGVDNYSNIYQSDGESLHLICDLPNDSKQQQTQSITLLYAYGQQLLGNNKANIEEIRSICSKYSCLDKSNFAFHIKKGDPKYYISKGDGKNRTIELTRPGEKRAKEIIEAIKKNV